MRYGGEKEARAGIERLAGKQADKRVSERVSGQAVEFSFVVSRRAWRLENRAVHEMVILVGRPIHPGDNLPMNRKPGTYYRAVYRARTLYYYDY